MKHLHRTLTTAILATGLLLSSQRVTRADIAAPPKLAGKLLIIGGNIGDSGPRLYKILGDAVPAGSTIGIIPTASGDIGAAIRTGTERISPAAPGRVVRGFELSEKDIALADNVAFVKSVETCNGIFFSGGQQDRVMAVFKPVGRETLLSKAVEDILARGGIVAGTSAGAAIMCDPMILGGDSDDALAGTRTPPLPMGQGLGYFPYGIVDQHFLERGRFGRLIVAMELAKRDLGFGVSEARAMLADRTTGQIEAIGTDAVLMIDRRQATERTNLRVSLAGNGDTIDGNSGKVTPAAAKREIVAAKREGSPPAIDDAWKRHAIRDLLHGLARSAHGSAVALHKTYQLQFSVDERTKFFANAKDASDITVIDVRLDLVKR